MSSHDSKNKRKESIRLPLQKLLLFCGLWLRRQSGKVLLSFKLCFSYKWWCSSLENYSMKTRSIVVTILISIAKVIQLMQPWNNMCLCVTVVVSFPVELILVSATDNPIPINPFLILPWPFLPSLCSLSCDLMCHSNIEQLALTCTTPPKTTKFLGATGSFL